MKSNLYLNIQFTQSPAVPLPNINCTDLETFNSQASNLFEGDFKSYWDAVRIPKGKGSFGEVKILKAKNGKLIAAKMIKTTPSNYSRYKKEITKEIRMLSLFHSRNSNFFPKLYGCIEIKPQQRAAQNEQRPQNNYGGYNNYQRQQPAGQRQAYDVGNYQKYYKRLLPNYQYQGIYGGNYGGGMNYNLGNRIYGQPVQLAQESSMFYVIQEALEADLEHPKRYSADNKKLSPLFDAPKTALDRISVYKTIAEGLDVMHRAGYSHEDLKNANVMIANQNFDSCKLIDFGMSEIIGDPTYGGTPIFNSPEKINNLQRDRAISTAANDIWALGLIIASVESKSYIVMDKLTNTCFRNFDERICWKSLVLEASKVLNKVFGNGTFSSLVKSMLSYKPENRPSASDVVTAINKILAKDINQDEEKQYMSVSRQTKAEFVRNFKQQNGQKDKFKDYNYRQYRVREDNDQHLQVPEKKNQNVMRGAAEQEQRQDIIRPLKQVPQKQAPQKQEFQNNRQDAYDRYGEKPVAQRDIMNQNAKPLRQAGNQNDAAMLNMKDEIKRRQQQYYEEKVRPKLEEQKNERDNRGQYNDHRQEQPRQVQRQLQPVMLEHNNGRDIGGGFREYNPQNFNYRKRII